MLIGPVASAGGGFVRDTVGVILAPCGDSTCTLFKAWFRVSIC